MAAAARNAAQTALHRALAGLAEAHLLLVTLEEVTIRQEAASAWRWPDTSPS